MLQMRRIFAANSLIPNLRRNHSELPFRRHHKKASPLAPGLPHSTYGAFFFGVIPQVFTFIFHDHNPTIGELTDKVGVEPLLGGLKAE